MRAYKYLKTFRAVLRGDVDNSTVGRNHVDWQKCREGHVSFSALDAPNAYRHRTDVISNDKVIEMGSSNADESHYFLFLFLEF